MSTRTRRSQLVERIGLIALVGVIAVVFLSSSLIAGVIAVVTITAVLVDSLALARLDDVPADTDQHGSDSRPRTLTVDLSRRS